jgi:ubiquitin C-terminal hydrolase
MSKVSWYIRIWQTDIYSCNKKCDASKSLRIYDTPPILTIQLKRFEYTMMGGAKIGKHIDFPERLTIRCLKSKRVSCFIVKRGLTN